MPIEMTPLCGYGMAGATAAPAAARTMKQAAATEGATIAMPDEGGDGMLMLTSAGPLQLVNLALPVTGPMLQMDGICSMQDIASIEFTGGTVLNAPTELLSNQAILLQRIDKANNTWVTM